MRVYRPSVEGVPSMPTSLMLEKDRCWMGTDRGGLYCLRNSVLGIVVNDTDRRERVRAIVKDERSRILFTTDKATRRVTMEHERAQLENIRFYEPRSGNGIQDASAMKTLAIAPGGKVLASAFAIAELIDTVGHPTFVTRPSWSPENARIYCLLPEGPDRLCMK